LGAFFVPAILKQCKNHTKTLRGNGAAMVSSGEDKSGK
jgi:hypothetical protein